MQRSDLRPYFAVDWCNASSVTAALVETFRLHFEGTPTPQRLFAMVDTAFDIGGTSFAFPSDAINLYAEGRWSPLRMAGPVLLEVGQEPAARLTTTINRLVRHCNGRPMLSFLASTQELSCLTSWLLRFVSPRIETIDAPLLRFADTRIAAELSRCLSMDHWQQLTAATTQWWVVDRCAQVRALIHQPSHTPTATCEPRPFELSDHEVGLLTDAGLPDALVHTLSEQLLEFLPPQHRSSLHGLMKKVLACAERHSIASYPDQYALAVLAITRDEQALDQATLHEMLARHDWVTGKLASRLAELL